MRHALLLAALLTLAAFPARAERLRLVVPAYQYPTLGTLWADLTAAAPRVPVVAILDPANGPGEAADPNYTAAVAALRAAGGRVYGYVYTHYAARGADTVLADAARFDSLYALDGWFVDEVTADADPAHFAYYAGVVAALHARAPGRPVLGNPGIDCDAGYVSVAHFDQLLTFEHWAGYDTWAPAPWMSTQSPARFVNAIYARHDAAGMRAAIALAASRNVGGVYVTDDSLPNPWDSTPAYWAAEVASAESTVVTPPAAVAPAPGGTPALRAFGNPARGGAALAFAPRPFARTLRVFDASGRERRALALPAGASSARWDGRDDAGAPAPPGVYFARLAGERGAVRLALLR
jgi:hypothetical protein